MYSVNLSLFSLAGSQRNQLREDQENLMENMESSCVPPGFRFRPTEEQLVGYYLKRKVNALTIDLNVIVEVDLYRIEPWDIQGTHLLKFRVILIHLASSFIFRSRQIDYIYIYIQIVSALEKNCQLFLVVLLIITICITHN